MIFISKKAFENEVNKRIQEVQFMTRTEEKIWGMEEEIRRLNYRVQCLEERNMVSAPKVNIEGRVNNCNCPVPEPPKEE